MNNYRQVPPHVVPPHPPLAPQPKRSPWRAILITTGALAAALLLFVACGAALSAGRTPLPTYDSPATIPTSPPPAAAPEPPATDPAAIGDGTHIVGVDIQPGTYRSTGAVPGLFELCIWSTKDGPATNANIIDFGTANANEPMVVEITASVGAFESSGCSPWVRQ